MLQFGASLTYDTSSINYDHNMFIKQATGYANTLANYAKVTTVKWFIKRDLDRTIHVGSLLRKKVNFNLE